MKRHPALLLLALLVGFSTPALAQEANPAPVPDISYEKFVLDNGLTLIVHEDRKAPIVAVNVWYHVGSKNEPQGRSGFAHLFEHLMFNGTENFDDDYFQALERVGATDLNGTTNEDRTNYFQNVPTSALDVALWMESDRMGNLLGAIDQEKLDEQRGVVQNEKRQGENQPYGQVWNLITRATYPDDHPYGHTVIGSMEDLNAAELDDVKDWFRTYYGASNAVIAIAGDIDAETAKAKVEEYFGSVPPGEPIAKFETWVAKREGEQRAILEDRVPQARIYKVWNVPEAFAKDEVLLDLAQTCPFERQDLPPLQAARLRGPDRHGRRRLPQTRARSAASSSSGPRRSPAPTSPRWRRPSTRSSPGLSRRGRPKEELEQGQDAAAGRLRPRHRADRRLRRQERYSGVQRGLRRQPRRL